MMKGIVYQGRVVDPGFEIDVVDGRTILNPRPNIPEMWWDPKNDARNCRERTEPIEGAIIHHQAGEGDADNCFAVLNARPRRKRKGFVYLSVHFEIDQLGTITQFADIDHVTKHAGNANGWSWGVEIANNGQGKPSKNWPRDSYIHEMHGRKRVQYLAFYDAQKESTAKLVNAVHTILGLKMDIPTEDGHVIWRELTDEEMEGHQVFAHFHLTDNKPDPSPDMMSYLLEHLPMVF